MPHRPTATSPPGCWHAGADRGLSRRAAGQPYLYPRAGRVPSRRGPELGIVAATVRVVNFPQREPGVRPQGTRVARVRGTRQSEAVAAVLDRLPGFCSAQQIHAELRERGEAVGLTTVYRHLQALSEAGRVDAIRDSSGEILYRRCRTDTHHHHLT